MREEAEIVPPESDPSRKCQPLVSVTLLGTFRLEWHTPSAGEDHAWKSRTSARSLFKLLLCAPNRQATRSQLLGILWPEADEHNARESLRSAIKVLRRVLRPGSGEELVETRDSEVVKLADQSRLFVDVDAFETLVQQAGHMTDQQAAFPLWMQARELVRGEFLADERISEWMHCRWIKVRRQLLRAARRRMIRSLADLSIQSGREAQAEALLSEHVIRFPTDQDALYRLIKLLMEAECFDEARAYYEQGKAALALLGKQPTDHLKALETFLIVRSQDNFWHTRQVERTPITPLGTIERLQRPPANQQQHPPSLEKRLSHHRSTGVQPTSQSMHQRLVEAWPGDPLDTEALVSCASCFAPLLERAWSLDALFQTLRTVLPVVKAIQMITRRQFLQTGATTLMSSIASLHSTHITEEDRSQLCQVLSESITQGWHLFGSSGTTQILALGQTQLFLLQQIHALLYPVVLPFLYTGTYSLIGIALHFQERDQEALHVHQSGYIAAVATGDPWYVAQSLICQSDCYHALGQYAVAIQGIEEALRTLTPGDSGNTTWRGAKAHLLTCWADNAMMLKDYRTAQEKLEASASYLDHVVPNEEFDRAAWHLLAGKYRLVTKEYGTAVEHFKESLALLPEIWTLRRAMTSLGLIKAYARIRERDQSLLIADEVIPMVQTINARVTNRWLHEYLQHDLLSTFSTDERVRTFVKDTYKRLPQLADVAPNEA